jgi:hypothetical protein
VGFIILVTSNPHSEFLSMLSPLDLLNFVSLSYRLLIVSASMDENMIF